MGRLGGDYHEWDSVTKREMADLIADLKAQIVAGDAEVARLASALLDTQRALDQAPRAPFTLYLTDATRRKHPVFVPARADATLRHLVLTRTDYRPAIMGDLVCEPDLPKAYWVTDVHDDAQLGEQERGGYVVPDGIRKVAW